MLVVRCAIAGCRERARTGSTSPPSAQMPDATAVSNRVPGQASVLTDDDAGHVLDALVRPGKRWLHRCEKPLRALMSPRLARPRIPSVPKSSACHAQRHGSQVTSILQFDGGANVPVVTKFRGQSASIKNPGSLRLRCGVGSAFVSSSDELALDVEATDGDVLGEHAVHVEANLHGGVALDFIRVAVVPWVMPKVGAKPPNCDWSEAEARPAATPVRKFVVS